MANYVKALKKSELASGEKKTVVVAGKKIMIANIGGEFFAIDDTCTHAGCSLGTEGALAGSVITCGCHGGQFNVTSGKVVGPPPSKDEISYAVKVEGDDVMVSV
jgi:3-phenylpropionate/trans-cinnamate dioxygenase ferredoxin component